MIEPIHILSAAHTPAAAAFPLPPEAHASSARVMMWSRYPQFTLLNALGDEAVNPRRVCFYWGDAQDVRAVGNRYRYGIEETGDGEGTPLYIHVPENTAPERLTALVADIRKTYPQAFKTDARMDSILVSAHSLGGAVLADGDENGGYDLSGIGKDDAAFPSLTFRGDTKQLISSGCKSLWNASAEEVATLLCEANANQRALQLNGTVEIRDWDGNTDTPGPGGNAFLFCPEGYKLPDGRMLADGGVVRVLRKGDDVTWTAKGNAKAPLNAVFAAWQQSGGYTLDLRAAPARIAF